MLAEVKGGSQEEKAWRDLQGSVGGRTRHALECRERF